MRLIDADKMIEEIVRIDDLRRLSTATMGKALSNCPTVDAVPVVRCEKCIHHRGLNAMEKFEYGSNVVWCNIPHFGGVLMKNDAFCSYGERKDEKMEE